MPTCYVYVFFFVRKNTSPKGKNASPKFNYCTSFFFLFKCLLRYCFSKLSRLNLYLLDTSSRAAVCFILLTTNSSTSSKCLVSNFKFATGLLRRVFSVNSILLLKNCLTLSWSSFFYPVNISPDVIACRHSSAK
jgi:hypothetical protein